MAHDRPQAQASSAPDHENDDNPRIDPPRAAENLAESFLPRPITVNRADEAVRRAESEPLTAGLKTKGAAPSGLPLLD
jgi:hypothetical protein